MFLTQVLILVVMLVAVNCQYWTKDTFILVNSQLKVVTDPFFANFKSFSC